MNGLLNRMNVMQRTRLYRWLQHAFVVVSAVDNRVSGAD